MKKSPIAREEVFVAHSNALLTPLGRLAMVRRVVQGKQKIGRVARDLGISRQTVRKWVRRYLEEGRPVCGIGLPVPTLPRGGVARWWSNGWWTLGGGCGRVRFG